MTFFHILLSTYVSEARKNKCDCKTDWLWVWSPLVEMKYFLKLIFPFLCSGVEAKRGVEFSHLTRNASRIRQKARSGVSYTKFPLPTLLCAGYSVKLIYVSIKNIHEAGKVEESWRWKLNIPTSEIEIKFLKSTWIERLNSKWSIKVFEKLKSLK